MITQAISDFQIKLEYFRVLINRNTVLCPSLFIIVFKFAVNVLLPIIHLMFS